MMGCALSATRSGSVANNQTTPKWLIEATQMAWGQWRASAIKEGSLERDIDGPYRETYDDAKKALMEILNHA